MKSISRTTVYIVEDNPIAQKELCIRLEKIGYKVVGTASSGEKAITEIPNVKPNVILMDIWLLGDTDGIQSISEIRKILNIPFIYLSGETDPRTIERAKHTEPYGYLTKPYLERDLHTSIELALYKFSLEEKAKLHEQWLNIILENIEDAVVATDTNGIIRYINPVARSLTGYWGSEVDHYNLSEVFNIANEFKETPLTTVSTKKAEKKGYKYCYLISKDKIETPIRYNIFSIYNEENNISGAVIIFQDISNLIKAEEAYKRYIKELEEINTNKDKFFSMIAHDLRSPFQGLLGYSHLLVEEYDELTDDDIRQFCNNIYNSTKNTFALVENFLHWTRIQNGKIPFTPEKLNLYLEVQASINLLLGNSMSKKVSINNLINKPIFVNSDSNMIQSIMVNLLSNAIKFSKTGGSIKITSKVNTAMVEISVIDSGIGMTQESLNRLFRVDDHFTTLGTDEERGTGLGLIITKELVEKQGGSIKVSSLLNKGTIFTVTIPAYQMN